VSGSEPAFDAVHPSGRVMFRSCGGGYLHSVVLSEAAMDADAAALAEAVLLTAEVSHLRAVMRVREEVVEAGFTPSAQLPGPVDLQRAETSLLNHVLVR
jgi:hypothetical protein